MFKIGEFSRVCFVSVKTLRYYDEIGLLKPVEVDRFTGYRYYTADQIPRVNYIVALKDLGLTLEEVATLVNNSLTPAQMRDIFILKQAELRRRVEDEQRRLKQVEKLLERLEQEGKMPQYQIVIKKLEPMKVACVRGTVPTYHDIMTLGNDLVPIYKDHPDKIAGPFLALYHDMEYREKDVDIEVCLPVSAEFPVADPIRIRDLDGVATAATTIHKGAYDNVGEGYQALLTWCDANGYELAGPDREVYLTGPGDSDNPQDWVTELQQPVRKKA